MQHSSEKPSRLPILLSIPHGGLGKPPELVDRLCIADRDIFDDSDAFASDIYDVGDTVARVIKSDIARAFIDLNRSIADMPNTHPDGLIKNSTCYMKPIYLDGMAPSDGMRSQLIHSYYMPYHREIQKSIKELDLQLCLDCHSMASVAPDISPDRHDGLKRPMFCLSNNHGQTSTPQMLELLSECISESFGVDKSDMGLNYPFLGGHITRTYGNNPIPWIQVEINQAMYLQDPWFDADTMHVDPNHIEKLNRKFESSLVMYCDCCDF